MNGKRCAIYLGTLTSGGPEYPRYTNYFASTWNDAHYSTFARIFGSHSEAKRELVKWLPSWPDATIVEEMDL